MNRGQERKSMDKKEISHVYQGNQNLACPVSLGDSQVSIQEFNSNSFPFKNVVEKHKHTYFTGVDASK